jgi:DNA-binding NtrC family response regulator
MSELMLDSSHSSVLIVDDEPGMRTALQANFLRHGWNAEVATGARDASVAVERSVFDLVVSDVRMRDGDGFEVLCSVLKKSPSTAVILLTAFGTVPEAVRSMRSGAFDYLTKPVSFDQLQVTAARVLQRAKDTMTLPNIPNTPAAIGRIVNSGIIGRSPLLIQALQRARAAASTDADVLIEAESGTGKELMAKFIHETSDRSQKPFIAVNCAAVPEYLLESELFGHAKGAFTGACSAKAGKFELADGGTLLLDEVGEMPLSLQPKLLRILQEREFERLGSARSIRVNIRVIATTNASLTSLVEQGKFRSLRDRQEDIPALAKFFADRFRSGMDGQALSLEAGFIERLQSHCWPGNIRELSNFMRRVLSLNQGESISAACFDNEFQLMARSTAVSRSMLPPGTPISVVEKLHLENTLASAHGNRTHAAVMRGISLRTMRNKIKQYGLPPRGYA